MSPLQQRMLEDMQLRGLSARTGGGLRALCGNWLDIITVVRTNRSDEELRQYFLYLTNENKLARPTATIAQVQPP